MRLSAADLETSRKQPQQTKVHLSIFQPRHIMKCRVNNPSAAKGDRVITYDTVTLGSSSLVEAGMTLLIGSSDGASDVGKIRIRSATASQFVVSENSNIEWADNQFLTVIYFFELWPVFPRIIHTPPDETNVTFFKDYDIAYSNQNSILGTFVNAGPHRAAFLDCASGQAQLWYSSTGTFNLLGDSLNYNWTFEGGSPSSSSSANPGYVTYDTPGHYVTRLQVSGSSGAVDTTYRYVSMYDRPECGTGTVPTQWEFTSFDGSRSEGGYNVQFKVRQPVSVSDGSVVVMFTEDWYGDEKVSLGGNYPNASDILFVGYVIKDTIRHNYRDSYVEFEASSLTGHMKNAVGFSVSVESKTAPSRWYELKELDCRRAIYHYLRWHTTALNISDFQFVGTDRFIQYFDADRTSMFDAIDNLMRGTLIGSVCSDRQGKVWVEVDAAAYTTPESSFPPVMTIDKRDWMNEPTIEERLSDEVSYLELGGIAYTGNASGTFAALMASAPGNAPGFRGKLDRRQGLALLNQTQLNQLAGNVWANENSKYPTINMETAVSARNLDIAPQETAQITVLSTDTARDVSISGLYIPDSFNWRVESRSGILRPTIGFKNLVNGDAGETIPIPDVQVEGGFSVPGLQIPPLPSLTIPPFLGGLITGSFNINTQIQSYMNIYADIGWHENASNEESNGGISIVTKTRSAGAGSIEISNIPLGLYYCSGFASSTASSVSAGAVINGTLQLEINGVSPTARADTSAPADSLGNARQSASVGQLVRISNLSLILHLAWNCGVIGGSATHASPIEFALVMFRMSA